jgi:hypothetical protein
MQWLFPLRVTLVLSPNDMTWLGAKLIKLALTKRTPWMISILESRIRKPVRARGLLVVADWIHPSAARHRPTEHRSRSGATRSGPSRNKLPRPGGARPVAVVRGRQGPGIRQLAGWPAGAVSVSVRSSPRCRRRFSWPPHADKLRSVTLLQRALPRGLPRGPRSATLLLPMTAALDHACVQRGPRTALSVPAALAASFFILFFSSRVSSLWLKSGTAASYFYGAAR